MAIHWMDIPVRKAIKENMLLTGCLVRIGDKYDSSVYHNVFQVQCFHDDETHICFCANHIMSGEKFDITIRDNDTRVFKARTTSGAGCNKAFLIYDSYHILEIITDGRLIELAGFPLFCETETAMNPWKLMVIKNTRARD